MGGKVNGSKSHGDDTSNCKLYRLGSLVGYFYKIRLFLAVYNICICDQTCLLFFFCMSLVSYWKQVLLTVNKANLVLDRCCFIPWREIYRALCMHIVAWFKIYVIFLIKEQVSLVQMLIFFLSKFPLNFPSDTHGEGHSCFNFQPFLNTSNSLKPHPSILI